MSVEQWTKYSGGFQNGNTIPLSNDVAMADSSGFFTFIQATIASIISTGPIKQSGAVQTGAVTLAATDKFIQKLDATGGAFTVTLPAVAASTGLAFMFMKTDSSGNLPTLDGNASETINGATTYTALSSQYKAVLIWCDGTQWLAFKFA